MVRVLKRTMVLDISGLPATLGRFQIAKAVDYLYCEDFIVKSVQFTPGKRLHVVFDGPEAKNAAEQFMPATIHGVTCRVVESGPHVQLINVYHYPYEEDNAPLLAVLGGYTRRAGGCAIFAILISGFFHSKWRRREAILFLKFIFVSHSFPLNCGISRAHVHSVAAICESSRGDLSFETFLKVLRQVFPI